MAFEQKIRCRPVIAGHGDRDRHSLLFILIVQAQNFPLLLGEPGFTGRVWFFYALMLGFPVLGVLQALRVRSTKPTRYATILDTIAD